MGRPTKDTYYRQYFEGRKLNKLLYEAKNAHELTTLYNDHQIVLHLSIAFVF